MPLLVLCFTGAMPSNLIPTAAAGEPSATPVPSSPSPAPVANLPVRVAANDRNLRYVGRFSPEPPDKMACAWSNSTVELKFNGTAINAELTENGKDYWQVVLDGGPGAPLALQPGTHVYTLAAGLSQGAHTLSLVKRTEPMVGSTTVVGFQLNAGGQLWPVPAVVPRRKLEVVGDSISCGYGNEGTAQDHFRPGAENGTLTYGSLAARAVGADYHCIAWSGEKMWPGDFIPKLYDRTLPKDPHSRWDSDGWMPDVVVINLGANDFANIKANPDRAAWVGAYKAFIARTLSQAPNAVIYCALNPMTTNEWPPGHNARTTLHEYLDQVVSDLNAAGDRKVHFLEFAHQLSENGIGADGHPSLQTHRIMRDALLQALAKDPGWPADPGAVRP